MSEWFFIEFRPWRRTRIREFTEHANTRLVKLGSETIEVNHMTLYGPSEAKDLGKIARKVEDIAKNYDLIEIKTNGIHYFDNADKKWIVINIKPNQTLEKLRYELYQALCKMSDPQPWDKEPIYKFHVSIGKTTKPSTFNRLRREVDKWTIPEIEQFLLRICIINGHGKIYKEYDLIQKRLLDRHSALSHREKQKTIQGLRRLLNKPSSQPSPAINRSTGITAWLKKLFDLTP